jgi:CRP-like cAMP-binding protein
MSSTKSSGAGVKNCVSTKSKHRASYEDLKTLIQESDSKGYPTGVELFRQDATPNDIYFQESGLIKLSRSEENGREFILDLRFPGSLLGSEAAIQNKPHPFSAVTASSCRLTHVSAKRFLDLLKVEPALGIQIQHILSEEVLHQAARMSELACLPARQRLEQLLWKIAEHMNPTQTVDLRLALPLKYWEAAQLLAITPTYLSRLLNELEAEKIINRKNGWIGLSRRDTLWHRDDI